MVVKIDLVRINVVEPFEKNSSCRNWSVSKWKISLKSLESINSQKSVVKLKFFKLQNSLRQNFLSGQKLGRDRSVVRDTSRPSELLSLPFSFRFFSQPTLIADWSISYPRWAVIGQSGGTGQNWDPHRVAHKWAHSFCDKVARESLLVEHPLSIVKSRNFDSINYSLHRF